jgi:hypothetical protein
METSKPLTGETLFDLTLYAEDTPANHLALRDIEKANKTNDTYGLGLETPLANYDQNTQSWKMYGDISLWEDCQLLETLPVSGMTRNGALYQRQAWAPLTGVTESSLWATPTASLKHNVNWMARVPYRWNAWETPPGYEHLGGQPINLEWLEWLMGFPMGWTDAED